MPSNGRIVYNRKESSSCHCIHLKLNHFRSTFWNFELKRVSKKHSNYMKRLIFHTNHHGRFIDPKNSSSLGGSLDWEIYHFIHSPQLEKLLFFIDYTHKFNDFEGKIPLKLRNKCNLLTLLTSKLRDYGRVVLTTNFTRALERKIEMKVSWDSKQRYEMFSYHFTTPLPILDAKQVTNFLDMFIDTSKWFKTKYAAATSERGETS